MLSHYHRQQQSSNDNASISSHTNYRYLRPNDQKERMHRNHVALISSKKRINYVQEKISSLINDSGVEVSTELNNDLLFIMRKNSKQVKIEFPDKSFSNLFWEQQLQAASVKDARVMRWHPLIIKWCLYLQHKSSGAYDLLRKSGQAKECIIIGNYI